MRWRIGLVVMAWRKSACSPHPPSPFIIIVQHCDEPVCASVCISVRSRISKTIWSNFIKFSMQLNNCDRNSVLLWRRCDMLRTSGLVDDVMFSHNEPKWRRDATVAASLQCRVGLRPNTPAAVRYWLRSVQSDVASGQ